MKPRRCRLCGQKFQPEDSKQHTCGCEDDEPLDPIASELSDPQVKARIEAGVRKEMEP